MSYVDPLDTRAQERAQREQREQEELERQNAQNDLKKLLNEKWGRRIVARWLEITGVDRSSFHTSGSVMAFNEGMRNVGLRLLAQMLEADPECYALMIQEQAKK